MKNTVIIAVSVAIIIGVIILAKGCKSGKNGVSENTYIVNTNVTTTDTATEPITTVKSLEYIEITVMDSDYIYSNSKTSIKAIISAANDDTIIRITNSNATYDAMSELMHALSESHISYVLQQ